jgi:hypothetical protein
MIALVIDRVHLGEHVCVVALGIGIDGTKHPLALVEDLPQQRHRRSLLIAGRSWPANQTRPLWPQVVRGQQLCQDLRINLVGLTFVSAMVRVLAGLDTTTRPARLASTVAIAHVLPVTLAPLRLPGAALRERPHLRWSGGKPSVLPDPGCTARMAGSF